MSCRVLVERVGRRRESGNPIHVALDLTVPAGEIVVSREATMHARVAIRDAFESARRRLQDFARRQRGDVKRHEPAPRTRRRAVSVKPEARLLPAANK